MCNLTLKKLCALCGAGVLALSVLPAAQAISVAPGYDLPTVFAPSGPISASDAVRIITRAGPERVPDSGATFSLLGIAIGGLAFLRRKLC